MDATISDKHKHRSIAVSKGHQRAILKACGVIDAEIDRPLMKLHGWKERYQAQVTSSNTGAVLTPDD